LGKARATTVDIKSGAARGGECGSPVKGLYAVFDGGLGRLGGWLLFAFQWDIGAPGMAMW
jgi:hypothetical protein